MTSDKNYTISFRHFGSTQQDSYLQRLRHHRGQLAGELAGVDKAIAALEGIPSLRHIVEDIMKPAREGEHKQEG